MKKRTKNPKNPALSNFRILLCHWSDDENLFDGAWHQSGQLSDQCPCL